MPARYWINWSNSDMIRDKELGMFAQAEPVYGRDGFATMAATLAGAMKTKDRKTVIEPADMPKPPLRMEWPRDRQHAI